MTFLMAGGGTGGHVIPAIAVARELVREGHEVLFVGTERGVESRLVPAAGFRLEKIRVGGLKNLGFLTRIASLWQLIVETAGQLSRFGAWRPAAVFSMGGYVAGPPVLASLMRRVPVVVMEPNAIPGVTNRWIARWVSRALIAFEETKRFFPGGRTELTGLPVREEFFRIPARPAQSEFTVLITGGSQGSQRLNNAARASWPLFGQAGLPVRFILQTGRPMHAEIEKAFGETGLPGSVCAFIDDMPGAFAEADLIVCRSGAGAVAEIAAAGKPSVMVPFPFAADDHQLKNAEAFKRAGAAILVRDAEWTGERLFQTVSSLFHDRERLAAMSENALGLAHYGAASKAAKILIDIASSGRNNKL